jgi:hydroxymethylglutaryl-CoA reductase (NADPH)
MDHGSTVIVSTSVFVGLSAVMHVLTRESRKVEKAVKRPRQEPRWGVLKWMNYVVMAVFVSSITWVMSTYKGSGGREELSNDFLLPMMVLWCGCLAYFLGFFGISFLDKDALSSSPSSFGLAQLQKAAEAKRESITAGSLQPRHDAPICSDRPSAAVGESRVRTASAGGAGEAEEEPDYPNLANDDVLDRLLTGRLKDHQLEKKLGDYERAVEVRRLMYEAILEKKMDLIPYTGYDYNKVFGANCEIVVGYVPIPVGIVGPILINGDPTYVPMATTEGCLVASTNRGCKAITASGGATCILLKDAITRAPCVKMPSALRAGALKRWVEEPENYVVLEEAFNSTTNFGRLDSCSATVAGRNVYLRFCCMAGDAMGMNMVSKGCLKAIEVLEAAFPDMILVAISGNMCTDKKPSAINWIQGRGKSIVCESIIPEKIVRTVLKSTVAEMIDTNKQKNLIGSAMAGSIGGFNAHASNIVTAVFLATGQDPAQNVESSNCITMMDFADDGVSLQVSVTMPSVEVGTVGGGTHLPAQAGCLEICGVRGATKAPGAPGDNSRKLAQIVGASVLAGELSLMAALAANHLVRSHMQHNRKPQTEVAPPLEPQPQAAEAEQPVAGLLPKHASMPELSQ